MLSCHSCCFECSHFDVIRDACAAFTVAQLVVQWIPALSVVVDVFVVVVNNLSPHGGITSGPSITEPCLQSFDIDTVDIHVTCEKQN